MQLKPGLSALVTGGASGIGKALSLALAKEGIFVTIVDLSEEKGKEAAFLIANENKKFHPDLKVPTTLFIKCNVTNTSDVAAAFEKHLQTYGRLDICINGAGIPSSVPFYKDETDGEGSWRQTVRVNLIAVIDCTRLAIQAMRAGGKPGVIINLGSASGLYPMYQDPIYSATKGGVVLFTRSLLPFKRQGIRINVLCPEFVETELSLKIDPNFIELSGGFLPMEMVVNGAFELIKDESKAGKCLWITKRRGMEYWPSSIEEGKYLINTSKSKRKFSYTTFSNVEIPQVFEKIVVHSLSHHFRNATKIVRTHLSLPIKPHYVLIKILFAGVNASDVNFSSGRYFSGNGKDVVSELPFDAGFEVLR